MLSQADLAFVALKEWHFWALQVSSLRITAISLGPRNSELFMYGMRSAPDNDVDMAADQDEDVFAALEEKLNIGADDHSNKRLRNGAAKSTPSRRKSVWQADEWNILNLTGMLKDMIPPQGLSLDEAIKNFGDISSTCLRTFMKVMRSICAARNGRFYRVDQTDLPQLAVPATCLRDQDHSMIQSVQSENDMLRAYNVSLHRRVRDLGDKFKKQHKAITQLQQLMGIDLSAHDDSTDSEAETTKVVPKRANSGSIRVKVIISEPYNHIVCGRGEEPTTIPSDMTNTIISIPLHSATSLTEVWRATTKKVHQDTAQVMEKVVGVTGARKAMLYESGSIKTSEYSSIIMETANSQKLYSKWYEQLVAADRRDVVDVVFCIGD